MAKIPRLVESGEVFEKTGLVHKVLKPDSGAPPYPTVILIHGRLGNEDVMWIFAPTIPSDWQVISVRAIIKEEDGYSWNHPLDRFPTLTEMDPAVDALVRFIQTIPELYDADPEQIYLMGFSQGAAAAYATAIREPQLVKAIAGLVGFLPQAGNDVLETMPLKDFPIFMAVGEKDDTIPVEVARQSGAQLRAAGAWLDYREYATGHKLNGAGMRKLKSWWEMVATHTSHLGASLEQDS